MSLGGNFVRLQLDESILDKVFKNINDRLDRHEQMILELQRLLRDKPDKSDFDNLRDDMKKDIDNKTALLEQADFDVDYSSMNIDGFIIRTVGNMIFINGANNRGTLYGVYDFLEKISIFLQSKKYNSLYR